MIDNVKHGREDENKDHGCVLHALLDTAMFFKRLLSLIILVSFEETKSFRRARKFELS